MDKTESASIAGSSAEDIMALARGFQKSRVLLTAFELGLFTYLGGERKSSAEVAAAVKTDARAMDRLMNILCALGLLEKSGGHFANAPIAAECLVEGQPRYLANLAHSVNLWDTWSTLTDAVRQGTTVADRPTEGRGKRWLEAFIGAMHTFASQRAPEVVGMLDLSGVTPVLDENQTLIGKCAQALNPNGQLVIKDFIVSEDRTHPADAALFALNMLVATEKGDTYTEPEVCLLMETAGLSRIEHKDTSFGSTLIIGRKA